MGRWKYFEISNNQTFNTSAEVIRRTNKKVVLNEQKARKIEDKNNQKPGVNGKCMVERVTKNKRRLKLDDPINKKKHEFTIVETTDRILPKYAVNCKAPAGNIKYHYEIKAVSKKLKGKSTPEEMTVTQGGTRGKYLPRDDVKILSGIYLGSIFIRDDPYNFTLYKNYGLSLFFNGSKEFGSFYTYLNK